MKKITPGSAMLAGLLMASAGSASAGTVTFNDFVQYGSDAVNYVVTIDHLTDTFTVNVKIADNSPNTGDILGIAFDLNNGFIANNLAIKGDDIEKVGFNTLNNGGGNNFQGSGDNLFSNGTPDVLLTIGDPGSRSGLITQTSFTFASSGKILEEVFLGTAFGIRAQSVGPGPNGGSGSSKDIAFITPDEGSPVPIPAAVWFMGTGLLGLFGFARARKTSVAA
ncbi:VPLPA-CTERM sorting domain-containing protein [Methylicorpusculum oleiharenae]|uniref:VPLPA-CTERM sorting domain-containing protein n=1 Tax=Methylicorpusculum oleiharenae TaxID=1338687 RepID=UPI00135CA4BF|nr:VPLPA-CTERM sorting domain-containing protein [Methylicorpusculum oleiharenae]MCD2450995.1 VPLPA-CTERM sorting domain-containing protein [Methylicorpusculum oleiharenae]